MRGLLLSIMALIVLAVAGCGSSSSSSTESSQPFSIPTPGGKKARIRYEEKMSLSPSGLSGSEPKPIFPKGPPPKFLALTDQINGVGNVYLRGEELTVQYVGYEYDTHRKFASSWEEGKPFTFTLGKGEVIPGWEEGLEGIEGGDRRELVVPPDLTEGSAPRGIPAGKALIFVVEPVPKKSSSSGKPKPKAKPKQDSAAKSPPQRKPKVKVPSGPPPQKLVSKDLKAGEGQAAKAGDEVTVQYVGVNYRNGKQFDASWDRGEPFTFTLGAGQVIEGWDQGIEGMKPGGRRELIIPPELGYGSQRSGSIPPYSTLVFVVDLLEIN